MIRSPDALTASERRTTLGLKDGDTEPVLFQETTLLGDRLVVRHYRHATIEEGLTRDPETGEYESDELIEAEPVFELTRTMWPVTFQGAIYPKTAPLVALQEGLGLDRNSPEYRRFMGLAQTAIGPGDPAIR